MTRIRIECTLLAILSVMGFGAVPVAAATIFTTMDDPLGTTTQVRGVSGGNTVGIYISSGNSYSFAFNGSAYTTLTDPLGSVTGAFGINGNNIVGTYITPLMFTDFSTTA